MAIKSYFQNIADAIRAKGGTVATLTPAEMPQAIADLPSGGGGVQFETPVEYDMAHNVYIASGSLMASQNNTNLLDVYRVTPYRNYILFLGTRYSNRFRIAAFSQDITQFNGLDYAAGTVIINGHSIYVNDSPIPYMCSPGFTPYSDQTFLGVTKTNNGTANVKTYLLDVTNF